MQLLDTENQREHFIFEDENNQEQIEDRIEETLAFIIGYNPLALVDKTIQVRLSNLEWQSENDTLSLDSRDLKNFSFVAKTALREAPDDSSRFELIPKEEILLSVLSKNSTYGTCNTVEVKVTSIYSNYVSWQDNKLTLRWTLQVEYCNEITFELLDCTIKQLN